MSKVGELTLTPEQLREKGLDVLFRELGPVDAIRFIQLFYGGKGDYTEERHNWLKYQTVDEVMEDLQKRRETLQQEQESSP